jgi:RHS repeat-associated protein
MHSDERGSVIAISDGSGVVTTINKYDGYGKPQSANAGRFQYTGQLWLPEIGAYYYKARFYSPEFGGRFLQTDPIASAGGINLYAYVGNDPVNWSDPLGLECPVQPCGVPIVVTAPITVPQPPTLLLPGTYMPGGLGNMIGEMVTEISNDIREATSQNQCPTAPSIDDYLRSKSSPVAGMGQQFIDNGQQFNIDPRFVVSIMGAETGFGRRITAGQNNLFNNLYSGRQSPFDSFSRSIYSEFKMLRGPNYQDRLGSTGSVYSKYCNGADCANGLANINIFMSEQGADPNKLNNPCPEKVGK